MVEKLKKEETLDVKKVNEVLSLTTRILKIAYFLIFIIGIYAVTLIFESLNILPIIAGILKMLAPLFIGIAIAWLLDPLATKLNKKGIDRKYGTLIIIFGFIVLLSLILSSFLPLMKEQIDQFVAIIPNLIDTMTNWINSFFSGLDASNASKVQESISESLNEIGKSLTSNLPTATIKIVSSFFSGLGTFAIGLIIGFYLLLRFDKVSDNIKDFLPKKYQPIYHDITLEMNTSLRNFVSGVLFSAFLVFIISSIGFSIVGLKSPVLFGLICGLTNMIPYIGPYIGGTPAVIVGFTISPATGIFTFLIVVLVQLIESFLISPMVMSKAVKLHPVTIIVGLVIFGNFFGIVGMILATPIIAILKILFKFLITKYDVFNFNN